MKNKFRFLIIALIAVVFAGIPVTKANAKELDRIKNYTIHANVNEDATVTLKYHIDWEVLDSTSEGPLEWVKIGIPNDKTITYRKLTDNIKSIKTTSSSGEYFVRIDFDRAYKKGEVVSFEFEIVQDYMYQMNKYEQGYTVFEYIPGWFDEIKVENITVYWATERATSGSPTCTNKDGYFTWKSSLGFGEIMNNGSPISVTYPNEAFMFDANKTIRINDGSNSGSSDSDAGAIMGFIIVVAIVIFCVAANSSKKYNSGASFGTEYDKKITRTKVTYYANCPGCGAVREEGKETCAYCGRSMIQSEEKIEEKDVPKADKGKYDNDGLFSYNSIPNTYVRVHVTKVPRPVSRTSYSGSSTRSHSSCAHSSCACACACACAGGGRAGCSAKDFYNTNLKLRDLMLRDAFGKKN